MLQLPEIIQKDKIVNVIGFDINGCVVTFFIER